MSSTFQTNKDSLNSRLWIRYEDLPKKEKNMFLDISCLFCDNFFVEKGLKITTAIQIQDQDGLLNFEAIEQLIVFLKNQFTWVHYVAKPTYIYWPIFCVSNF